MTRYRDFVTPDLEGNLYKIWGQNLLNLVTLTDRCQNCCEDLCAKCVDAHQRVKMTRSHTIIRYANQGKFTSKTFFADHVVIFQKPRGFEKHFSPFNLGFSSAQQSLSAQQGAASLPSSQGGRPIVASPGGGGAQASSLADVSEVKKTFL